jgi:hypothetical protein
MLLGSSTFPLAYLQLTRVNIYCVQRHLEVSWNILTLPTKISQKHYSVQGALQMV